MLATCMLIIGQAQNQNFEWVKQIGGSNGDVGREITVGADGNILITGSFQGTVDFDPGIGIQNLIAVGSSDVFIQKLDANGNFLWATSMGQPGSDSGQSIITDVNNNVYVTGFVDNVSVGGIETSPEVFVQKLDVDGNILWTNVVGTTTISQSGLSVATDTNGNVYVTGYFGGTVDFDSGAGVQNLTAIGFDSDIFIQKLDTDGNFLWAKQMGGDGKDWARSITLDINGNIYTTGEFEGVADFDPGAGIQNLTAVQREDAFIQKLDNDGNFLWVKQIGGTFYERGESIITDTNGDIYTIGHFGQTTDFDPGVGVQNLTANGIYDIFIQKLDTNGDFLWVKQMGGNDIDYARAITMDDNGYIYSVGSFEGTVDFDPGVNIQNLTSEGNRDIFIQKLDTNGNFVWVKQMGGVGSSYGYGTSVTTDTSGNVYTTGYFGGTLDFNPEIGIDSLTAVGNDVFIQKLSNVPDCIADLVLTSPNDDYQMGDQIQINTSRSITASNTVGAGSQVIYEADSIVILQLGFSVQTQCDFEALIGECNPE